MSNKLSKNLGSGASEGEASKRYITRRVVKLQLLHSVKHTTLKPLRFLLLFSIFFRLLSHLAFFLSPSLCIMSILLLLVSLSFGCYIFFRLLVSFNTALLLLTFLQDLGCLVIIWQDFDDLEIRLILP